MADSGPGFKGHITSLKPIRPENAADSWETAALTAFEHGVKEVTSVARIGNHDYLRYMSSLTTEKSCLKCHADQGYKEGDIRGGIGVSVPLAPLRTTEAPLFAGMTLAHLALWVIGLAGIVISKQGLTREVHARGRAEQAAAEGEELFRSTFEASAVGAALAATDRRLLRVNAALCRMTGYEPAELEGRDLADITHPDEREQNLALVRDVVEGRSERLTVDRRCIRKDGATIWVQVDASLVRSAKPAYLIAQLNDITERKRAEAEVNQRVEELRAANSELQMFNRLMVDRELRMGELKEEVDELRRQAGVTPRYAPDAKAKTGTPD
jgi:PAS domain S-box-containing protein